MWLEGGFDAWAKARMAQVHVRHRATRTRRPQVDIGMLRPPVEIFQYLLVAIVPGSKLEAKVMQPTTCLHDGIASPVLPHDALTDPKGFDRTKMTWKMWFGLPMRRLVTENWFQIVVRVGSQGLDEQVLTTEIVPGA